jgi:2-dehydropantoate 2-reductase
MRIGIIGLGAIGGVVAARVLARRVNPWSEDVVALAAGRAAAAIRASGVRVDGEAAVRPASVGEMLPEGVYDLILLCTRTGDTERALGPAAPCLAPDGAVVCLQNGLPEERAAAIVGRGRVLGAVIGWSASMRAPGDYVVTGGGNFVLGGESPRRHEALEVLCSVFPVRETDNLAGARWSKLAMNCAMSTLGAISGLSLGEMAARRDARGLALRVVAEAVGAARGKGVRLEPVAGIRPDLLLRLPAPLQHAAIWLAARRRPGQRTGMIERLRSGRPAGVEDLNALVDAPLNRRLVEMVHEIERGQRRISPDNLAQLA